MYNSTRRVVEIVPTVMDRLDCKALIKGAAFAMGHQRNQSAAQGHGGKNPKKGKMYHLLVYSLNLLLQVPGTHWTLQNRVGIWSAHVAAETDGLLQTDRALGRQFRHFKRGSGHFQSFDFVVEFERGVFGITQQLDDPARLNPGFGK